MSTHKYAIYTEGGVDQSITWYLGDETYTADRNHDNFKSIVWNIKAGSSREHILSLFSPKVKVNDYFQNKGLFGVHFDGSVVWVNGRAVPTELSQMIIDHVNEGTNPAGLVAFFGKLLKNPSYQSQQQLVSFINRHGLTITPTGNFIAYKGLGPDGKSVHSGGAYVDGTWVKGRIPNEVGTTITMDRGSVNDDTTIGCSTGLHAGTWKYASGFGRGGTCRVEIDPEDVVSVPKDCDEQKLRVCRYSVVEANLKKPTSSLVWEDNNVSRSSSDGNTLWRSATLWSSD